MTPDTHARQVGDLRRLEPAFENAAKCLAATSDSLSAAAQALAEAAKLFTETSRAVNASAVHTSHQGRGKAKGMLKKFYNVYRIATDLADATVAEGPLAKPQRKGIKQALFPLPTDCLTPFRCFTNIT